MIGLIKKKYFSLQKGFTLIEILVVIAILGVIAGVATPVLTKYFTYGKAESYDAELHDVRVSLVAMLSESISGTLDDSVTATSEASATNNLYLITTTGKNGTLHLSDYLEGLDRSTPGTALTRTGCKYWVDTNNNLIFQVKP